MKQRAKELDMRKRAERAGGSKSYGSSTGISSSMYSSSSNDTKPDVNPTPVSFPSSTSSFVSLKTRRFLRRSKLFSFSSTSSRPTTTTGKGMKLGTKGKNVESFVDQLKSEGQAVLNTVSTASGAAGPTSKAKPQSISIADADKGE